MKKTLALIISIFFLLSCADKQDPEGLWDDIIQLSTKSARLKATTDSVTITTGGDWWWINGIEFNDSTYIYYNREDIDLESDNYSIQENCFLVERRDKNTLFVQLDENTIGNERSMIISLEAGDYFDTLVIHQEAE